MKTIYTRPVCPACSILKAQLNAQGIPYTAVTVYDPEHEPEPDGNSITRAEFNLRHPGVRGFPFEIEE